MKAPLFSYSKGGLIALVVLTAQVHERVIQ